MESHGVDGLGIVHLGEEKTRLFQDTGGGSIVLRRCSFRTIALSGKVCGLVIYMTRGTIDGIPSCISVLVVVLVKGRG